MYLPESFKNTLEHIVLIYSTAATELGKSSLDGVLWLPGSDASSSNEVIHALLKND